MVIQYILTVVSITVNYQNPFSSFLSGVEFISEFLVNVQDKLLQYV